MKGMGILLLVLGFSAFDGGGACAAEEGRNFPADYRDVETHPEVGEGVRKYAVDDQPGPQRNFGVQPVHDDEPFATFRADRFEFQARAGEDVLLWDVEGWFGGDYHKVYLESEGEKRVDGPVEEAEVEVLYSRNIGTFWDLQVGVRHDFRPLSARTFGALGVEGLAPHWFEVDATGYVSEDGDVSARLEAEYHLLLTQRLILQPRLETSLAVQDAPEFGVGSGFNDVVLGLRLRYEIRREFAPYVGLSWTRKLGQTAHILEAEGGDVDFIAVVAGIRFWL